MPGRTSKEHRAARRSLFIEAYLANGGNGADAYREAGFRCKSRGVAKVGAWRLLRDPQVMAEIDKRRAALQEKYELDTDRVIRELARVCHFTPKRLVDRTGRALGLHEIDDDTAAALVSVQISEEKVGRKTVTKIVKTRALNKTTALGQAIKILRLYDKPPPPPPEEGTEVDPESIKALAFLLEEQAHRQRIGPASPKTVVGKRVNGKEKSAA